MTRAQRAVGRALGSVAARLRFRSEFRRFAALAGERPARLPVRWSDRQAELRDRTAATAFDRHYVFHTAWAARVLARTRPAVHVDVGSSLFFVGVASAFVPVRFYDYRPATLGLDGLETGRADLLALPFGDGEVRSLSCMHVVEHVGLGRYGDPLDPDGDLKAMAELRRVLAPGGSLLLVVPVGRARVAFNAHRVYAYEQAVAPFQGLKLEEFALVPDSAEAGGLVRGASAAMADAQEYGCGCFWFVK